LSNAVWSKGSKEAGSSGAESKVFLVWKRGTQEVGVSRKEEKKRGSTSVKSMGEDKVTLWGKGAASTRSSNGYGRVDDEMGGSNPCRVQRIRLQGNKNSGEQGTGFPEQRAVVQHIV